MRRRQPILGADAFKRDPQLQPLRLDRRRGPSRPSISRSPSGAKLHESTTSDELAHMVGRLQLLEVQRLPLQPENGNLPQALAALPALLAGTRFPELSGNPYWKNLRRLDRRPSNSSTKPATTIFPGSWRAGR